MIRSCFGHAPSVDPTAFVEESAQVLGQVRLAARASVWFGAVVRGDINRIEIGERSNVQDGCVLHVTRSHPVRIGADVTLGHRAVVHGAAIGDRTLVGIGAIVLDGAEVGPDSLVAAGAVVTPGTRVPAGSLVAGVPARVVRALEREERERAAEPARNYLGYAERWRAEREGR